MSCLSCGKPVLVARPGRRDQAGLYCSRVCGGRAVGRKGVARLRNAPHSFDCAWCDKHVTTWHRGQRFCSITCASWGRRKVAHPNVTRPRRGLQRDRNHDLIAETYRTVGAGVLDTAAVGGGFPDLIIGYGGRNYLVEVKNTRHTYGRRGLNARQRQFAESWPDTVHVVTDIATALAVIGLQ